MLALSPGPISQFFILCGAILEVLVIASPQALFTCATLKRSGRLGTRLCECECETERSEGESIPIHISNRYGQGTNMVIANNYGLYINRAAIIHTSTYMPTSQHCQNTQIWKFYTVSNFCCTVLIQQINDSRKGSSIY